MKTFRTSLARWFPRSRERGIALLMTLGILSLVLILAMSFAFDAQTGRLVAETNADLTRARLLLDTGTQQALGFIKELENTVGAEYQLYPGNTFFPGPSGTDWEGRSYVGSVNETSTNGIIEALHVEINGADFTPATELHPKIGWQNVFTTEDSTQTGTGGTADPDRIIGRYAYLIIDASGMADPGTMVGTNAEGAEPAPRVGDLAWQMNLKKVLGDNTFAEKFQPVGIGPGQMPAGTRWFSYAHMFRGNDEAVANADAVAENLVPAAVIEPEEYWMDMNGNGQMEDSEFVPRIDITDFNINEADPDYGFTATRDLYNTFTGSAYNASRDDSRFFCQWLNSFSGESNSELRRRAAQVAMNIIDYVDTDTKPQRGYIDPNNNYRLVHNMPGAGDAFDWRLTGVDRGVGRMYITEVLGEMALVRDVRDLIVYTLFKLELYTPGTVGSTWGGTVKVTYEWEVEDEKGAVHTQAPRTVSIPGTSFNQSVNQDGGTVLWTGSRFNCTPPPRYAEAFYPWYGTVPPADPHVAMLHYFRINKVQVIDGWNLTVDIMPATPTTPLYETPAGGDTAEFTHWNFVPDWCWLHIEARDGLKNNEAYADQGGPNGDLYFSYIPFNQTSTADWNGDDPSNPSDTALGVVAGESTFSNAGTSYNDTDVKNAAFSRVGEIGRVRSWDLGRSLRLWSAVEADEANNDGSLLDMFRVGSGRGIAGKINLNSNRQEVLKALLDETGLGNSGTSPNGTAAAAALRTETSSALLQNIGEIAGINGISGTAATADREEEARVTRFIELSTVRQNVFVVVTTAQALRDVGTTSVPGAIEWENGSGKYALVQGEQRAIAVVQRDAYTGDCRIVSFALLE